MGDLTCKNRLMKKLIQDMIQYLLKVETKVFLYNKCIERF